MVSTVAGQPVNSQPVDRRWDPTAVRGVRSRSKYRFRTPNGVKAQTGIDAVKVADCTSGEPWQGGHANPYMQCLGVLATGAKCDRARDGSGRPVFLSKLCPVCKEQRCRKHC